MSHGQDLRVLKCRKGGASKATGICGLSAGEDGDFVSVRRWAARQGGIGL